MKTLDEAFGLMMYRPGAGSAEEQEERVANNFEKYKSLYRELLANAEATVFACDAIESSLGQPIADVDPLIIDLVGYCLFTGIAVGIEMEKSDFVQAPEEPKQKRKQP